jgi:hypothetical protein
VPISFMFLINGVRVGVRVKLAKVLEDGTI